MSDSETALVQELRALAGVSEGQEFDLVHEGVRMRVAYSGGSSSHLSLSAPYDSVAQRGPSAGYRGHGAVAAIRPMRVALQPEHRSHREGKESGMDVEYQTGDPEFDAAVYVDTRTLPEVLAEILTPEARRAVLDLFAIEFTTIVIDDLTGRLYANLVAFASLTPASSPGRRAADAFARLARQMPRVVAIPGRHAPHPLRDGTLAVAILAVLAFCLAAPIYFGFSASGRCDEDMPASQYGACLVPGVIGLVVGLVAAVVAGAVAGRYGRRFRGRSDSSKWVDAFAAFCGLLVFSAVGTVVALVFARLL